MVDVSTFINREGVDYYRVKLYMEEYPPTAPGPELIGLNAPDKDGNTPLMYAIKFTNEEIAGLLLKKGADINAKNNAGETAMTFATKRQDPRARKALVYFLLENGVDNEAREFAQSYVIQLKNERETDEEIRKLKEKEQYLRNKLEPVILQRSRLRSRIDNLRHKLARHGKPRGIRVHSRQHLAQLRNRLGSRQVTQTREEIQEEINNADKEYIELQNDYLADQHTYNQVKDKLEKAYAKQRVQTGSKRNTQRHKRTQRSKKTRGRK